MIGRAPSTARDIFDSCHDGTRSLLTRFHQSMTHKMHQLVTKVPSATELPVPSCAYESRFVRPWVHSSRDVSSPRSSSSSRDYDSSSDLVVTGLEGISILIASYLDGRSLGRMMLVNKSWSQFVTQHRDSLLQQLLATEFVEIITSSSVMKTYLFSLRHQLDRELAHSRYIHRTHAALEEYCTSISPDNHGFVAMFCDIIRFRDPRIAKFVAQRRGYALSMVLTATPDHVEAFRRTCPHAGPIAFVPFDNPHWPQFDLPPVKFPGFMGYAFEHVEMVKGYEAFKHTVVKSILKEMMLFDTAENAAAYGRSVGKPPYAAIVGGTEDTHNYGLAFSNPLREELTYLSIRERIAVLMRRIAAVDHSITRQL